MATTVNRLGIHEYPGHIAAAGTRLQEFRMQCRDLKAERFVEREVLCGTRNLGCVWRGRDRSRWR